MAWMESIAKKAERARQLRMQFPEFEYASPDEVLRVDNYRLNHGGFVSDFSQMAMRLAKHAAELAEQSQAGAPDFIQGAADRERAGLPPLGVKRAGVPRGVAEAFPETAVGRKVYESSSSGPSINPMGSLLDNREGLPGPLNAALDVPVLGRALTEIARPANWMSAAIAPLSFAPRAGMGVRLGAEVAGATAGTLAGQFTADKTEGLPGPLRTGLTFGAGIAASFGAGGGVSRASGLFGGADDAVRGLKGLPDTSTGALRAAPPVTAGGSPLSEVLDAVIPGQKVPDALLQRYEGRVNTAGLTIQRDLDRGNELLKTVGIGRKTVNGLRVERSPEMEDLFKALHGEAEPPVSLRPLFDDLKRQIDVETQASLDFDPKFMARPDYFPRGWRAPKETRPGMARMGSKPGFKKARVDATFSQMLEDGWEPRSWNPYEMLAERRVAGELYREQTDLVRYMQDAGVALKVDGPVPAGYRIPRVGPAFEGKPNIIPPGGEGALPQFAGFSARWAVPDQVADVVENMYGSPMSLGKVGPVDVLSTVRKGGAITKRTALVGSLFQQVDFTTRVGFSQFGAAVDALTHGHPIEAVTRVFQLPTEIGKLAYANVSSGRRAALRDQILSDAPIFADRPGITLKGIAESGWSQRDISILPRNMRGMLEIETPPTFPREMIGRAVDRIKRVERSMQDGLFDGVYPQAQITALKNFVVPAISRQHPDWTDAQIMASAATEVNKMFSTLGDWQTMFKNRGMRELARNLIFSTNEPEALIKGAFSTVSGPNKRLWAENYIGGALFLAGVANLIHKSTTGEWLPLDRYSPVTLNLPGDSPLDTAEKPRDVMGIPMPVGYNTRTFAPEIPIPGRNDTKLSVDLMGQMDTVFRLLDPLGFVTTRFSRPVRAFQNQAAGADFYGRPLDGPAERVSQAVSDLLMPITGGSVLGALGIGPENEARLGKTGQLVQGTGVNLRAENNQQLRDRAASEYAAQQGIEGVSNLDELASAMGLTRTNAEKRVRESSPNFDTELDTRRAERADGDPETAQRIALDEKRKVSREDQERDDARVQSTGEDRIDWDTWKENRTRRLNEIRGFSEAVYGNEPIAEPKNAYEEWLNVIRDNNTPDGVDWDAVDAWVSQQDETRQKFIADNTGIYGTKLEKERSAAGEKLEAAGYFDLGDKVWSKIGKAAKSDAKDARAYEAELRAKIGASLSKRGLTPQQVEILTNRAIESHGLLSRYKEIRNDLEQAWIVKNRELVADAYKVGYFHGSLRGIEEAAIMSASKP